jgi:hypothetical protein
MFGVISNIINAFKESCSKRNDVAEENYAGDNFEDMHFPSHEHWCGEEGYEANDVDDVEQYDNGQNDYYNNEYDDPYDDPNDDYEEMYSEEELIHRQTAYYTERDSRMDDWLSTGDSMGLTTPDEYEEMYSSDDEEN